MSINIHIQKKDLWLLAAIMVFLIGVAYVIAYGSGNPQVHGHDASEIEGGGTGASLGEWTTTGTLASGGNEVMVLDHVYEAQTDGFVTVHGVGCHGGGGIIGYTDSNNPPTTKRTGEGAGYVDYSHGIAMPVKREDYFKLERVGSCFDATPDIYWIPFGS